MKRNPRLVTRSKRITNDIRIFIDKSFATVEQIELILNKKRWTHKQLAQALNKNESEISKWMSGAHNFTYRTIAKLEDALGEPLILCPKDFCPTEYRLYFSQEQAVIVKRKETISIKRLEEISVAYSTSSQEATVSCTHQSN